MYKNALSPLYGLDLSSDTEMSDSDSSDPESSFDPEPAINASVRPGPDRAVHKCKEYIRHPGIRATQVNHHNIYAAATLLHPAMRLARFKRN